jgi:hypothetical protein
MDAIPYALDAETQEVAETIRAHLAERKKAHAAEFRRRCEECKRLALDAAPMTAGERERVERELQGER